MPLFPTDLLWLMSSEFHCTCPYKQGHAVGPSTDVAVTDLPKLQIYIPLLYFCSLPVYHQRVAQSCCMVVHFVHSKSPLRHSCLNSSAELTILKFDQGCVCCKSALRPLPYALAKVFCNQTSTGYTRRSNRFSHKAEELSRCVGVPRSDHHIHSKCPNWQGCSCP